MSLKEQFHSQDWRTLQFSFLWIFEAVAGVDGEIDDKEQQVMQQTLVEAADHPLPLFREVLGTLGAAFHSLREEFHRDPRGIDSGLSHAIEILRQRVPDADRVAFREELLLFGQRVAQASGGILGLGNKVSRAERECLARLEGLLED